MTALVLPSSRRSPVRYWLPLLAVAAAAALVMGLPDRAMAQARADGQPTARTPDKRSAPQRPAARQRPAADPADSSADELNRRYNERLRQQAQADEEAARAADEARRSQQSSPGFFGRLFGSSSDDQPDAPPPTTQIGDPRSDPTASPVYRPQDRVAQVPPPASPAPRRPDQVAQAPQPPATIPPPPAPQPVPIQPPSPTLITPPPAVAPPVSPVQAPVDEAPARRFGRSAVVPTEQPSLAVDAGKGTIIRLKAAASTVFVANPDVADVQVKTGNTIYVFGKKPGETVLYAVDEQDRVLLNTVVVVGHPVGRVVSNVASMPGGANIQATTVGGTVVLQGRSDNPAAIEQARRMAVGVTGDPAKVINNVGLDGANQVLLKVRIVEAQRETLKRIGFNWEAVFKLSGRLAAGFATPTDIVTSPLTRIGDPAGGAIAGRYVKGGTDITGLIDLLATENMLTVLAEPNLAAMSGETASFLAGGEFPIIVPQQNGLATVTFKQFGVSLAFTPTIHGNGRITLRCKPEVSQLSTNGQVTIQGFTIPALTTRRVDTTVELASGQSFAIAGLIQKNSVQDVSKLPGLGEIPILGALFRSDSFQRSESELVVIVTPYLVRPSSRQLSTPLDGYVPPTDADRYLRDRTYRPQSVSSQPARGGSAPARSGGFMLE